MIQFHIIVFVIDVSFPCSKVATKPFYLLIPQQKDELLLDAVAHAEPVVLDGARHEVRPDLAVKLGKLHREVEVEIEAAKIIRRKSCLGQH